MKNKTPNYDTIIALATCRNFDGNKKPSRIYPTYTKLEKEFLSKIAKAK